jgi:hypothetical protein
MILPRRQIDIVGELAARPILPMLQTMLAMAGPAFQV